MDKLPFSCIPISAGWGLEDDLFGDVERDHDTESMSSQEATIYG